MISHDQINATSQTSPLDAAMMRDALIDYLTSLNESEIKIIQELGLCGGKARADITTTINNNLHCYEIKSDRDSFRRLPGQASIYNRVYDFVSLVVGTRHAEKAKAIVPEWWGIIVIASNENNPTTYNITIEREARENPMQEIRAMVELLWLEDAISLLEQHSLAKGMHNKPRRILWDVICSHIDPPTVASTVIDKLNRRPFKANPQLPKQYDVRSQVLAT